MRCVFVFILAFAGFGATTSALADVPTRMSVQGRLTDTSGSPLPAGIKAFTFKIFDAPVGGAEIWPAGPGEVQGLTTDANGLWNAGVGSVVPLTEAVFQSPVRWLQVTVDDGVNPPETLTRIELRTNPYTYRAATSQQADSIAGNSFGDLDDLFVNTSGDTLTGKLVSAYPLNNLGPTVAIDNLNDGWTGWFWDFQGTYGVISEAASNNAFWNVGLAGSARGDHNTLDANYGVIGYADGDSSINVGTYGYTGLQGTENYSGWFDYGDFQITNTQTPGTNGVKMPDDAIDRGEILDEPGIAFNAAAFTGPTLSNNATAQDFLTVSILVPSPGYVEVRGTVTFRFSGTTGNNYAWMQIDQTFAGGMNARYLWSGGATHGSVSNEYETASMTRVFIVAAGLYTFRIEGNAYPMNAAGASVFILQSEIEAIFQPTSYGGVSALVPERGEFEDATLVKAFDPQMQREVEAYQVDLRELELRDARAQAEAQKARRELLEARVGAAGARLRGNSQDKQK